MTRNYLRFPVIAAFTMPVVVALALAFLFSGQQSATEKVPQHYQLALLPDLRVSAHLREVRVGNADDLRQLLADLRYDWPPQSGPSVPRVAIDPLPADFDWPEDIQRMKDKFFQVLMPLALAENKRVLNHRTELELILADLRAGDLPPEAPHWKELAVLADRYQVEGELDDPALHRELLMRVDIIPVALVLAQAANESGWGSSRFAREANNLFGVWTYHEDAGIVPENRPDGENHLVRRYDSLRASVRSHIFNLNIGHAYDEMREMRMAMRQRGDPLDALVLAGGLERYSIRGQEYIDEIRQIIRVNDLIDVERADLREPESVAESNRRGFSLLAAAATAD